MTIRSRPRRRVISQAAAVAILLSGTPAPTVVLAQSGELRLSVEDAVARAHAASDRLAVVRGRHAAAEAALESQESADRPRVTILGGYQRTNHVNEFGLPQPGGGTRVIFPDIPDNYRARLDLQWPIYSAGRVEALVRAAGLEAQATAAEVSSARSDLALEVRRAYWALVTAREAVAVLRRSLDVTEAHLRDVRARFDAGLVPPNDVLSVEAQRSRQQAALVEAENTAQVTELTLKQLTGFDAGAPLVPTETLDRPAPSLPDVETQIAAALNERADRAALARRVEAAAARIDAASRGARPTIAAAGGYDYARPNPRILPRSNRWADSWDIGVNLSWTLWDGGRVAADTALARAERETLERRLAELDSLIALEVRQRRLDLASADARVTASADGIRSAVESHRVVRERFAVGVATSTEVLDAQLVVLQAELDRTKALADARLAEARLARALGSRE